MIDQKMTMNQRIAFFLKTNRKIIFVRSVNHDLTKLLSHILEIDNIEKYLIAAYSKLKENIFGSDIAKDVWTRVQYLIIKPGIKKIWNGYRDFLSPNQNIIVRLI